MHLQTAEYKQALTIVKPSHSISLHVPHAALSSRAINLLISFSTDPLVSNNWLGLHLMFNYFETNLFVLFCSSFLPYCQA